MFDFKWFTKPIPVRFGHSSDEFQSCAHRVAEWGNTGRLDPSAIEAALRADGATLSDEDAFQMVEGEVTDPHVIALQKAFPNLNEYLVSVLG